MTTRDHDTMLLEKLLDRYRFARPVPADVREEILASKKKIFVRVLKTTGAFSAASGAFLSLYFAAKKAGAGALVAKIAITCAATAALSYGAFRAVSSRAPERAPGAAPRTIGEIRAKYEWVDRITLYNGRTIDGAITARGETYTVLTTGGLVRVPRNQIKTVRPLNMPRQDRDADDGPAPDATGGR